MSLPFHFGTTPSAIPSDVPYIAPSSDISDALDQLLPVTSENRRIGLTWAGRASHSDDTNRSCRLADFQPLFGLDGFEFFSLQKEPRADDQAFLKDVVDLGPHLTDFGQTARAMQRLDLIISVDTAPAHLAGALARPVWLLLAHRAEWRWALADETTPWYPSMRLVRQSIPGDWSEVIGRLGEGLKQSLHRIT